MIITDVKLTKDSKQVTLSARCKIRKFGWDTLYFRVDASYSDQISVDASPFAASLLYPAMVQGENLTIHGSLPKQVLDNMHTLMRVALEWDDKLFKPIKITADSITTESVKPDKTATFFSGGVDSFYTFLQHKVDRQISHRVNDLILVHGFDIHPKNTAVWQSTLRNVRAIAKAEKVQVMTVETNVHDVLQPLILWEFNYGNAMAAIGLLLRKRYRIVYIPSTFTEEEVNALYDKKLFTGSAIKLDHEWSTKQTKFIHDGADATRLNKILIYVGKSPTALKHLRVCYDNPGGIYNCCGCDKCLRTMVGLHIAGTLSEAKTFPKHIDPDRLTAVLNPLVYLIGYHRENLNALKARQLSPDLQGAISAGLAKATPTRAIKRYTALKQAAYHKPLHRLIYIDFVYGHSIVYGFRSKVLGKWFF